MDALTDRPVKLALSVAEAAASIGVCERTAWAMIERGELPHVRLGKRVLVPVAELRAWLSRLCVGGAAEPVAPVAAGHPAPPGRPDPEKLNEAENSTCNCAKYGVGYRHEGHIDRADSTGR